MNPDSVLLLLVIIGSLIVVVTWFKRENSIINIPLFSNFKSKDTPIILSYFTKGHELLPVQSSIYKGNSYSFLLTIQPENNKELTTSTHLNGVVIYILQLSYIAAGHIVGVNNKTTLSTPALDTYIVKSNMDRVQLEGDYHNTFAIYASKDQGAITQYMLEPAAMAFTMKYCKNFIWEITGNTMYIISASDMVLPEDILERSLLFAKQLEPAIQLDISKSSSQKTHTLLYGNYDGEPLSCPLCKTTLLKEGRYQVCSDGHGILLTAPDIMKLGKAKVIPPTTKNAKPIIHQQIICPYCQNTMGLVDYQARGVIIDSCINCPFRWLDAHEAEKIANPLVKLSYYEKSER